jgi:hypothetical protein
MGGALPGLGRSNPSHGGQSAAAKALLDPCGRGGLVAYVQGRKA